MYQSVRIDYYYSKKQWKIHSDGLCEKDVLISERAQEATQEHWCSKH